MKSFLAAVVPAVCLMLAGAPALAQEAIQTQTAHGGGAPPVTPAAAAATSNDPEPDDVWARRVLNAAAASASGSASAAAPADGKAAAASGQCAPNGSKASGGDGKPHGEVWAGAGTRGYRDVGGVVTQPIGSCGSVTLMVDHTEGSFGRSGGRAK